MASVVRLKDARSISEDSIVTLTQMGSQFCIQRLDKVPLSPPVRKISKSQYVDVRTGEIFDYSIARNKSDSLQSVRRELENIRSLVNTNVVNPRSVRWITLTYAENMQDPERLYSDFHNFWKRFKRYCIKAPFGVPEYISVVEPQGRGAWHVHAFFIWSSDAPFIPNSVLADLWQQGFVKITAVNNCDNIGAYFSAYLADMPLEDVERLPDASLRSELSKCLVEEKTFQNAEEHEKRKKFVKGARLYLYPSGMHICRHSKGIKRPVVYDNISYSQAKEKISSAKLTFSSSSVVVDDNDCVLNTITKEYYNGNVR